MSVVLCGYHNMGCTALKVLLELGVPVPAVLTHRDDPDENRWFDSLAELARENNIPVYFPDNINDSRWIKLLTEIAPDILLSCYFRQMIKQQVLDVPRLAAVNLHGSLLPKYRGRCPVNWQLVHGEKKSGVTLHHMVLQADAGDIVGQKAVDVPETDTAVDLFSRLESAAADVLREYIPKLLDGTAPRIVQDHSQATYFGGRRPEDGRIDWSWDAKRIYNLVRAVAWPYPGAFFEKDGKRIMVWEAEARDDAPYESPGTVISVGDEGALVRAGKGSVLLKTVSYEEGSPEDAVNTKQVFSAGDVLGNDAVRP